MLILGLYETPSFGQNGQIPGPISAWNKLNLHIIKKPKNLSLRLYQ